MSIYFAYDESVKKHKRTWLEKSYSHNKSERSESALFRDLFGSTGYSDQ